MKAVKKYALREGEKTFVISGEITEIVQNENAPTLPARVTVRAKGFTPEAPKYITALCYPPFNSNDANHKETAIKASKIALAHNESLWCCIICRQEPTHNGSVCYKAKSISIIKTQKGSCTKYLSPYRIFVKDEDIDKISIVKGLVQGCFENNKHYAVSFVEDTEAKEKRFVSVKCFQPFSENALSNYEVANEIKNQIYQSIPTHAVIICKEREYEGRKTYTAITSWYAHRILK